MSYSACCSTYVNLQDIVLVSDRQCTSLCQEQLPLSLQQTTDFDKTLRSTVQLILFRSSLSDSAFLRRAAAAPYRLDLF